MRKKSGSGLSAAMGKELFELGEGDFPDLQMGVFTAQERSAIAMAVAAVLQCVEVKALSEEDLRKKLTGIVLGAAAANTLGREVAETVRYSLREDYGGREIPGRVCEGVRRCLRASVERTFRRELDAMSAGRV